MPDLDSLFAHAAAEQAPPPIPPFDALVRRHRGTRRRHAGTAIGAALLLATGAAFVLEGDPRRDAPVAGGVVAGPATAASGPDLTPRKVFYVALPSGTQQSDEAKEDLRACTSLPGVEDVSPSVHGNEIDPQKLAIVTVAGDRQIEAFTACVGDVPRVYVQQTVTTPAVDFEGLPGHPEDVSLVEICSSADQHECRSLSRNVDPDKDRALPLARAFTAARPSATQDTVCRTGTGDELTLRFSTPGREAPLITIRVGCPDVWVDGTRYALPGDVQASVREAFENPPWAGVADLVTQCVGYDRPQPIAELVGLPSSQAVERVREQGLPVRTLGSGSGCRTGSPKPYNGGRMTLVVSDSGVVLWANRG